MVKSLCKYFIILSIGLIILSSCTDESISSVSDRQSNDSSIIGTWDLTTVDGNDYSSMNIQLIHNQDTYTFISPNCTENGNYIISNNIITYTVTSVSGAGDLCDEVGSSVNKQFTVTPTTLTEIQDNGITLVFNKLISNN